jgi:hypothetical protein
MDYKNGKIYKIVSDLTDKIYIGSTCQLLCKRLAKHKTNINSAHNRCKVIELFKLGETRIELIEDFPCERKEQLNAREGYYIKLYKNICVNKKIEGRTRKQYNEENKDAINERQKQYNKDNKDAIKERRKQHRDANKEKIAERKKQYYQAKKASKLQQ